MERVAEHAGVPIGRLADVSSETLGAAVSLLEAELAQSAEPSSHDDTLQAQVVRAELAESVWVWAWRPGWMYLLGLMWFVRLMIVPVVDAFADRAIADGMPLETMMTLTFWFLGLYMGGHTLKTLSTSAVEAVRASRGGSGR